MVGNYVEYVHFQNQSSVKIVIPYKSITVSNLIIIKIKDSTQVQRPVWSYGEALKLSKSLFVILGLPQDFDLKYA